MKRIFAMAAIIGSLSIAANAGVFHIAKAVAVHAAKDTYHVVKYPVVGVAKAVKHAAGDAVSVVK